MHLDLIIEFILLGAVSLGLFILRSLRANTEGIREDLGDLRDRISRMEGREEGRDG